MGLMIVAVIMIVLGLIVRFVGMSVRGSTGQVRLASYALMFLGLVLAFLNTIALVDVGEVGVKHFLARVDAEPLP